MSCRQKGEIFLLPNSLMMVTVHLLPPTGDTVFFLVPGAEVVRAVPYLQLIITLRRAFFQSYADTNIAGWQSTVFPAENGITSFP